MKNAKGTQFFKELNFKELKRIVFFVINIQNKMLDINHSFGLKVLLLRKFCNKLNPLGKLKNI